MGHGFIAKLSPVTKASARPQNPKYPSELVTLGDHLRARRLELGLEQKDVANIIGVDSCSVNKWELNHYPPSVRHYPKIFSFLGYCLIEPSQTEGERLRLFRTHLGLSTKEIVKLLGVDPSSVQSWGNGKRVPSNRSREKMGKLWRENEG